MVLGSRNVLPRDPQVQIVAGRAFELAMVGYLHAWLKHPKFLVVEL